MKIAIIGSGISGLSCAYFLSKKHDVHIYESSQNLGGHANTINVSVGSKHQNLDTGFLVFNELTYPNFVKLLDELKVKYVDSDMSLSVQHLSSKTEWAGESIRSLFAQPKNLFKFSFWRMLIDVRRFQSGAKDNLVKATDLKWSIKDLIAFEGYGQNFVDMYLLPMGAAIWSTPENKILDFPAETFLNFFLNHKLLQWNDRPTWKTIDNGSRSYVQAIENKLSTVFKADSVNSVKRLNNGLVQLTSKSRQDNYDAVVFATHPPVTLKILENLTDLEKKVLASFTYQENLVTVHKDPKLMPHKKICWSSWNVRAFGQNISDNKLDLTYYINKLQPWIKDEDLFVSLNLDLKTEGTLAEIKYHHPKFTRRAIEAQDLLPEIQNSKGIFHIGAWTKYGFHEDGLVSAINVARLLGLENPWSP